MATAKKDPSLYEVIVSRKVTVLQRQKVKVAAVDRESASYAAVKAAHSNDHWNNIRELGHDYDTEVKKTK